ncbi:MAG: NupC/NupG family nucleoside CNT transporter [Bacteriovoracia bacterium]
MLQSLLGIFVFIGIAALFSKGRRAISWKFVAIALLLQFVAAFVFLKISFFTDAFSILNKGVILIQNVTDRSSQFLFGYLAGGQTPFEAIAPENGFIVVFRVLPLIVVVSAISALLFHWRIIPLVVGLLGRALQKTLGLSGDLSLGSAATVFFGTIEAPLLIRSYLSNMSRSDLFALISCSMATVSGTVMVLYSSVLGSVVPNPLTHLLVASIMSVPAALLLARVIIPQQTLARDDQTIYKIKSPYSGSFDAITKGIQEGMGMVLGIIGTILVFFALIYLVNEMLGALCPTLSLEGIVGTILRPFLWLTGVSWEESQIAGKLMGTKIILNEFVAYLELSKSSTLISEHSRLLLSYALSGFANIGSVGIIIGGLSSIVPDRRVELTSLTLLSLLSGNLATLMTAAVVNFIAT